MIYSGPQQDYDSPRAWRNRSMKKVITGSNIRTGPCREGEKTGSWTTVREVILQRMKLNLKELVGATTYDKDQKLISTPVGRTYIRRNIQSPLRRAMASAHA